MSVLANQSLNYLVSGIVPHRLGNAHPNIVPYQVFDVKDGRVMIAVGNDAQFTRLCHVLDLAALAIDPRYTGNADRVRERESLVRTLSTALLVRGRDELLGRLEAAGVPAGAHQHRG